jgi:transposase
LSHANARTNEYGRHLAVQRYLAGHKVRDIAGQPGISRTTVYKWIGRFHTEGWAGLSDRSSAPHRRPRQVPLAVELKVLQAGVDRHCGPV